MLFHWLRYFKTTTAWRLFYNDEDGWQTDLLNVKQAIDILPSTVITRHIIFLHYQSNGQTFYRMLTKDALVLDANNYRQLIVTLKTST